MASSDFSKVPSTAKLSPKPFKVSIPEEKLRLMKDILKISPIGPAVWENTSNDQGESHLGGPKRRFGMRRDWLINAKDHWLNTFNWRATEDRINAFPNYTASVTGADGIPFDIHFVALFSEQANAVPLAFYHGWPGSILEFLNLLDLVRKKYTPSTLPYHIIVPSLPGYAFTSAPPANVDYTLAAAADVLHHLMTGLGFTSYLAQGGDLGSSICRYQAAYPECKSIHLNLLSPTSKVDKQKNADQMSTTETNALARGAEFGDVGFAYGREHGTRTGTIGLALHASPLALLAWIGEKFLEWTDEDPSVDEVLESVTLYWVTGCWQTCLYPYRGLGRPELLEGKPFAFSFFPKEIIPSPKAWVEQMGNLVAYYSHEKGGHFAAFEQPQALLDDVEDWVSKVWTKSKL